LSGAAQPRAVIFDNDGLLLDTETVWTRAEQDLYERRGLEFTLAEKQLLVGTSAGIAGGILERRFGEEGRAAEIIAELDELVMAEVANGVEAMPGARDLVALIGDRGIPRALVSNSPRAFIERALAIAEIGDVFDLTLSAHEVAAPKPAPDPYLAACERLGIEPGMDVTVLEDSPTGVASGVAAGCRVIGVPSVPGVDLPEAHERVTSLADPQLLTLLGLAD
jgi:HAD superfamily hydrolase (TIGR01509 family)